MRVAWSHWHWIPLKWLTVGPELVLPALCKLRTGFWCDPLLWDPGMKSAADLFRLKMKHLKIRMEPGDGVRKSVGNTV